MHFSLGYVKYIYGNKNLVPRKDIYSNETVT